MSQEIQTGGGASVGRNVDTGGGGFAGRDSQKNDIRIDNNNSDYRLTALETRMTIYEGRLADFSRITDRTIDELRDELRREMAEQAKDQARDIADQAKDHGPTNWRYWLAIGVSLIVSVLLWILIQRLDLVIALLERLPKTS